MPRKIRKRGRWSHRVAHAWATLVGSKDVFIHHTAGAAPRTVVQEAQALRDIDRLHHNKGWAGIGYNFAVAQSGRAWAGRGWRWMGAHNDGENATTYGIVALGNFETETPTNELIEGIIAVIRRGQAVGRIRKRPRVRGHRDTDATSCPGRHLYARLPEIRRAVNATS